jgi:type IV pilus assembly protein PilY1
MRTYQWLSALGLAIAAATPAAAFEPVQQPPETSTVPGNLLFALSVEFPTGLVASYNNNENYDPALVHDGYFDNRKCYTYSTANELFTPVSQRNSDANKTCPGANEWSGDLLNWLTMTNLDQFRSVMTGGTRDTVSALSTARGGPQNGDSSTGTVLIRSFTDRNSYHINKVLPNTAALPAAYRNARVRNGGYGTKFLAVAPITDSGSATALTTANCQGSGSNRRSCWNNTTGRNVTVTSPGGAVAVANGARWVHSNNNVVTVSYSWSTVVNPSNASFSDMDGTAQRATCAATTLPAGGSCFNIRLQVCRTVPGVGMDGNCVGYASSSKPEGLVQQYANVLRYGAFGYLNQTGNTRNGGVLRSAMKSVGETRAVGNGSIEANPNREWNEETGVQSINPDPADATNSTVDRSGVINYLNQFGYAAGYKGNDPVSELYHAALLYLRGLEPPAGYSNDLDDARKDGFPVITGANLRRGQSRDPLINTCQKNFLLTIGDIYTHQDGTIPDPELNAATLWDTVNAMEGNAGWSEQGNGRGGTPLIAGLSYWAHTNDIRGAVATPGRDPQTVTSYFVDVLENYNGQNTGTPAQRTLAASRVRSQYWLAAKYGGYDKDKAADAGNIMNPNGDRTSWDNDANGTDGYNVPDNWFAGNSPTALRTGLSSAFSRIARDATEGSSSSAATTSSRQTTTSQIIFAGYNAQDWSGTLRACLTSQTAVQCASDPEWEASDFFDPAVTTDANLLLTAANRRIFTSWRDGNTFTTQPFQWSELNDDQEAILNASDNQGEARLAYLRGNRTQENLLFRARPPGLLGDIVHSGVTFVSGTGPALSGPNFPNHAAYRATNRERPPVVYVGANDGMLHAFNGNTGRELFGYVPGAVFANLPDLSAMNFQHHYFVDSTPMVGDVQRANNSWATYLVGGLGAGGRGYYALDITTQSTFLNAGTTEAALAALPIWEFTSAQDSDLGYTFNEPAINPLTGAHMQIAKVADATVETGVWRVIVGNGYGSQDERAVLFMLDANTGAPTKFIATDGAGPDNGLSTPTPVDTDRDGLIDTVYAGDLLGNMHKFQFSVAGESSAARPNAPGAAWRYIGRVFAGDATTPEPIVTAPSVAASCSGAGWQVAFGSGKLNEADDYTDTSRRSFITLEDTGSSASLTVPPSDLAEITYSQESLEGGRIGRDWATPNLSGRRGWRMHFTNGERVLGNSTLPPDTGTVLFATTRPSGDICEPGNTGFIMAVNMCSGASNSLVIGNETTGGLAVTTTGEVKLSPTYVDPENNPTVVCNQTDCQPDADGDTLQVLKLTAPRGRYNWREILSK